MKRALLVLATSCGFHPTAATTGDGAPPIDAARDDDATPDGSPDVDSDHDGLVDAVDNCIHAANPDQHDEDGDAVGDACDPCPQVAHEPVLDTDTDGLPDACDPHANVAGDSLVMFFPFTGTTLPAGWSSVAGLTSQLTVANDALVIDGTSGTQIVGFASGHAHQVIDLGAALPASPGGTTFLTAVTDLADDASAYIGCGIRLDTAAREQFEFANGSFTPLGNDPAPGLDPMTFPGTYRVVAMLGANTQACAVPGAANRHLIMATANPAAHDKVGIRVGNAVVTIRYAAIYTF